MAAEWAEEPLPLPEAKGDIKPKKKKKKSKKAKKGKKSKKNKKKKKSPAA